MQELLGHIKMSGMYFKIKRKSFKTIKQDCNIIEFIYFVKIHSSCQMNVGRCSG